MKIEAITELVGQRFHRPSAPTVVALARPSRIPIIVSHVASRAAMPEKTLAPPVEMAFAIHVHHKPLVSGETWINGKHADLPPIPASGICMFDLETSPVALVRERFEFSRFYVARATLDDLSYDHGLPPRERPAGAKVRPTRPGAPQSGAVPDRQGQDARGRRRLAFCGLDRSGVPRACGARIWRSPSAEALARRSDPSVSAYRLRLDDREVGGTAIDPGDCQTDRHGAWSLRTSIPGSYGGAAASVADAPTDSAREGAPSVTRYEHCRNRSDLRLRRPEPPDSCVFSDRKTHPRCLAAPRSRLMGCPSVLWATFRVDADAAPAKELLRENLSGEAPLAAVASGCGLSLSQFRNSAEPSERRLEFPRTDGSSKSASPWRRRFCAMLLRRFRKWHWRAVSRIKVTSPAISQHWSGSTPASGDDPWEGRTLPLLPTFAPNFPLPAHRLRRAICFSPKFSFCVT